MEIFGLMNIMTRFWNYHVIGENLHAEFTSGFAKFVIIYSQKYGSPIHRIFAYLIYVHCVYVLYAGRCSIVDYCGRVVCDIYAQPDEPITDYRTRWSGIRKRDMIRAIPVENARNIIKSIIQVTY